MTICNIICWSDSLDALHWIKGAHKKWKVFTQNKVEKIRKRHCPGNLNPADLPSRGTTATDLYNSFSEWNNGRTFLRQSINTWSMNISVTDLSTSEDNQVVNVVGSISSKDIKNINIPKYSTADRLFCVTAFILHFISNLKLTEQRKEIKEIYLTAVEIEIAEYTWIKSVQKEFFKDKSNLKQFQIKLGVYLDTDSIYKCKRRLINSSLLEHSKTPIFLPKESYLSNLIILKAHQNLKHSGVKDTINHVRSIYTGYQS